ncbi:PEPxxWA-CTERM sorting domain-containing protein [Sphingomonas sp. A2-49]|uniref:PEPxxWA-CTERM sorting domain-containing protein n=1 Tax=Sphingomonas sp. A2-49 TaxID=1391375 RepID=UPI0021D09C02|nr:PEPxxWA-CTERM sorting domain-containing protein [Sphingomonas sp. A2-49]MCU6453898.1 PEPxxWA-CTERM sorting domain-containing protein [Sphingomonas sp. A2-49]
MKYAMPLYAAAIVAAASPAAVSAEMLQFTLSGPTTGYSASWSLDDAITPDQWTDGQGFELERVAGSFPGSTANEAYIGFFALSNDGGLSLADADSPALLVTLRGDQLYTGPEAAPTLRRGVFALTDGKGLAGYTLTVAPVPEPAVWLTMILGFAVVGGALRTRRTTVRFA